MSLFVVAMALTVLVLQGWRQFDFVLILTVVLLVPAVIVDALVFLGPVHRNTGDGDRDDGSS